jgi:predicted nucleotidyltransferase
METLEESIDLLKEWCQKQPVRLCVLFGSQATGQTHAHSDVDLAIWPAEPLFEKPCS